MNNEELKAVEFPWCENLTDITDRTGKYGEIMPEEETDESKDILAEAKNGIDQIISNVGEEINNFVNREDVKTAVEKTKEGVVDAAEKALEILKGWLAPEREDK